MTPSYYTDLLTQSLASDKRAVGFFLGAGCPLAVKATDGQAPLIPDVAGLTAAVRAALDGDDAAEHLERIHEQLKASSVTNPTIEHVLTHIRGLRNICGTDTVRGFNAAQLETLDGQLCDAIVNIVDVNLPDEVTPFHLLAQWLQSELRTFPPTVFTTNYDTLIEQALEACQVPFFDGFSGSVRPFFDVASIESDQVPRSWTRLWKLHGSLSWRITDGKIVVRSTDRNVGPQRLIYPSHLKYDQSRRMPYLAMLDRLRVFFANVSPVLVTVGYSYSDEHINDLLIDGLSANASAVVFALMFGELRSEAPGARLARRHGNLLYLCQDGGIAGGSEMKWAQPSGSAVASAGGGDEFHLGDFAALGNFLQALSRSDRGAGS